MPKEIPLTQGFVAIVDDEDYEELMQWKWYANVGVGSPRATRMAPRDGEGRQKTILMHRQIMNAPDARVVDHINHDTLDNRRSTNLRVCTRAQNQANRIKRAPGTSQFKGVHWDTQRMRWRARLRINGREIRLGRFRDEKEAARAYNRAAKEHFKEFANLNIL